VARSDGRGWKIHPRWVTAIGEWAGKTSERLSQDQTPEESLKRAEAALALMIRTHGPDGMPTAMGRARVAWQLEKMDRYTEARLLREEVLAAHRHHLGEEALSTLTSEENLAFNLNGAGMRDDARAHCIHVAEVRRRVLGADNKDTQRANRLLDVIDGI
jgi:hypothetical protein